MSETTTITTAELRLRCPPTRVTLYEDRGELLREAVVVLAPGTVSIIVEATTAVVSDRHVTARLQAIEGGEAHVDDVRVHRRFIGAVDRTSEARAALAAKVSEADRLVAERLGVYDRARAARAAVDASMARWLTLAARSAGNGVAVRPAMEDAMRRFADEMKAKDAGVDAGRRAWSDATKAAQALRAQLEPAKAGDDKLVADLVVRASSTTGGRFRLIVQSLVPCALWRPAHEAELLSRSADGAGHVRFTTYASVWQRTGEDWNDIDLVLSTARPGAGAHLPRLDADRLTLRMKTPEEKKTIVVEHREESVAKADRGAGASKAPGVDDGGVPRVLAPAAKVTIPSDGRPKKVAVASFQAAAKLARVAFPELSSLVFLRATLTNEGAQPILAGPVTLLEEGAYTGTGDVLYTGSGEVFDLSLGSDDRFQVRGKRRRIEEEKMLQKNKVHFAQEATISSTATQPERIEVQFRLPLSEVKQLKIAPSPQHTTPSLPPPDEHGVVRTTVDVKPGEEKKLTVGFSFDASGDVRIPDPW